MTSIQLSGIVHKVKLLKPQPPLALVQLVDSSGQTHTALISHQALTFLLDVQVGSHLSLYGHLNSRQQIIIERYWSNTKGQVPNDLPHHLSYPHQKHIQE